MTDQQQSEIIQLVAEQIGIEEPSIITPESNLRDLGLDSLDDLELVIALEGWFDIHVNEDEANIHDVASLIAAVDRELRRNYQ